jgi:hypothetical protein
LGLFSDNALGYCISFSLLSGKTLRNSLGLGLLGSNPLRDRFGLGVPRYAPLLKRKDSEADHEKKHQGKAKHSPS